MKHLRRFNEELSDLSEDIAKDLLPRFQKMREDGKLITVDVFDKYMKERTADSEMSHAVMNHLVNMGFDFDFEEDEDGLHDHRDETYLEDSYSFNEEFIHDSDTKYISARMEEFSDIMTDHGVNFNWSLNSKEHTDDLESDYQGELNINFDNIRFDFDIDELLLVKTQDDVIVYSENVNSIDVALDIIEKDIYNYIGVSEKRIQTFNSFQKVNELNVHDIVKRAKSGKGIEDYNVDKLCAYVNGKFGGEYTIKNGELIGDDFIIRVSRDSFIVEKEGHKKVYYQFDKIGQMVDFIKGK